LNDLEHRRERAVELIDEVVAELPAQARRRLAGDVQRAAARHEEAVGVARGLPERRRMERVDVLHRSIAAPVWEQSARDRASATSATWPGWSSLAWPMDERNFLTTSLEVRPVTLAMRAALERVIVVSTYPGQIALTMMPVS